MFWCIHWVSSVAVQFNVEGFNLSIQRKTNLTKGVKSPNIVSTGHFKSEFLDSYLSHIFYHISQHSPSFLVSTHKDKTISSSMREVCAAVFGRLEGARWQNVRPVCRSYRFDSRGGGGGGGELLPIHYLISNPNHALTTCKAIITTFASSCCDAWMIFVFFHLVTL